MAVSLCAIDRGGREGGARERRRGPALLSIRGNAVSVVAGCFFDLSLSLFLFLSLSISSLSIGRWIRRGEKENSRYYWWIIMVGSSE